MPAERPPVPVRVLAGLLIGWVPASLALEASAALPRIVSYGWPAALLLLVRVFVAGLAFFTGRALWAVDPHGRRLAQGWLVLDLVVTWLVLTTPYFPGNWVPGMRRLALAGAAAFNGAWLAYLALSKRVRECWP